MTHYLASNGPNVAAAHGLAHALCLESEYGIEDFHGVALIHHDNQNQKLIHTQLTFFLYIFDQKLEKQVYDQNLKPN